MNRPIIEWTCPDDDLDTIIESLRQHYLNQANASEQDPKDKVPCKFGGYTSSYGTFLQNAKYHLGITTLNMWHGKDVFIKGFFPSERESTQFSIILFFYKELSSEPLVLAKA